MNKYPVLLAIVICIFIVFQNGVFPQNLSALATRKVINNEWMIKESKGKTCYFINNCKVFNGLPIIANETKTFNKQDEVFNNEEFIVKSVSKDNLTITNERTTIPHHLPQ